MQTGFITAPDAEDRSLAVVRQLIRSLVESLPTTELCQQAAINLALPTNMLDFARVLRLANSEGNLCTLQFTALQLRNLHKEVARLKNSSPSIGFNNIVAASTHYLVRRVTRQQTIKLQKSIDPQYQYWSILEEEVNKRSKLKLQCSNEKIAIKMDQLRKKAEKAKMMNKRVLKIFKNQQQKKQKIYEDFKLEQTVNLAPSPIDNSTDKLTYCALEQLTVQQLINPIHEMDFQPKERIIKKNRVSNRFDHEKYDEYRRRELKTREKKRAIEERNQSQAIIKVIKKQEKIRTLRTALPRKKTEENLSSRNSEDQLKTKIKVERQAELNLEQKFQQTSLRRQMHIQEKVNRVREELKEKEQRRIRHREQGEEYTRKIAQETDMGSNPHLRFQLSYELSLKQQKTIRSRYQQLRQKQNLHRFAVSVAKLSDKQLQQALQAKKEPSLSQLTLTG